jgi:serine/threonine-protein kinase
MAQPPPRPAARAGGPASPGASPASSSGTRPKDANKEGPPTFFLGRYRVVDEIGVGGMASVHLGRMDGPGGFQKWVAIKRIHPHLVEDDQFVDMFLDEARIAAGINHANVAQVFDLGKDDNTYWIAMEYLHGEPLREVMRRAEEQRQRIPPELAARICADAAEGLHAAHELRGKNGQLLGLVHRDVTPHNLFVTYDGYTKVVDFGIAKVADRLSSTRAGTLKGKLAYMSPEQVRGAEVDRTTDIFALGVVLWEVTTNQRLFRMDTDLDTLEKVQACVVPPPSTIIPGYPLELEACLMKALAKRKQDRYATAREFSRALQSYLARSGHFIGPEEVAQFVRHVFGERIQKREAHLAWASEVTSNVNIDQLRAGKGGKEAAGEEMPLDTRDERRQRGPTPAALPPSASGERPVSAKNAQIASQSLMDDDEDVPTTVAMRDALESHIASAIAPRPAAGLPAPQPQQPPQQHPMGPPPQQMGGQQYGSPASYAANSAASYAANRQPQQQQYAPGAPSPASYAANLAAQQQQQQQYGRPGGYPEHTSALPGPSEDLGSTVALPGGLAGMEMPRSPAFGGQYGNNGPPQYPQGGPAPQFGQQQNPQLTPHGMVGGVPMNLLSAPQASPGAPHLSGPQSQIETALSLPRPDPAALWLAQQEKQKGERRNTGVLIAVVALTALCVLGIGALVYFKLKSRAAAPISPAGSAAAMTASASAAAPPSAAPSASGAADAPSGAPTASASPSASASAAPAGKDPGLLTVICNPVCDDVKIDGKSVGGTPIVKYRLAPGGYRVVVKKGSQTKSLSVTIASGQENVQRPTMK